MDSEGLAAIDLMAEGFRKGMEDPANEAEEKLEPDQIPSEKRNTAASEESAKSKPSNT